MTVLGPGSRVEILGGVFAGRLGVVEAVLPSGKLRVRVETFRTWASAKVDPGDVRPAPGEESGRPGAGASGTPGAEASGAPGAEASGTPGAEASPGASGSGTPDA